MGHAYFGELSKVPGELAWEGAVELGGRTVQVWLWADAEVSAGELDAVAVFPKELARFDAVARAALAHDLIDGESVRLYIDHHLAEVSPEDLEKMFGVRVGITDQQFLAAVVLKRVHLRPEDPDDIACFDYSLDESVTNYLLAVQFDEDGEVTSIEMES